MKGLIAQRSRTRIALGTALGWFILALLSACASSPAKVEGRAPGLEAGTAIEVGNVTIPAGESPGVDAVALMREALDRALRAEKLLWDGDPARRRLLLNVDIADYEPGNAFKRWLLPGYGSTILQVSGQLVDPNTHAVEGTFDHKRGVAFGGAWTIGAWKSVFDEVAEDIATSLANRAFRDGFVIGLDAWASREIVIPVSPTPQTYTLVAVNDQRPDKRRIGERFAAFDVSMGNVYFVGRVDRFLAQTVSDELRAAGHTVQSSGPGHSLALDILTFWIDTETTPMYWDVIANISVRTRIGRNGMTEQPVEREFSCRSSDRTYVYPSQRFLTQVLDNCLVDLMSELRSDSVWNNPG